MTPVRKIAAQIAEKIDRSIGERTEEKIVRWTGVKTVERIIGQMRVVNSGDSTGQITWPATMAAMGETTPG
jgi:DNA-binding transcriptional regulator YdaS (Cro superfamily)